MHFGDIEHFEESCHKIGVNIRNKDNSYKSFGKVLEKVVRNMKKIEYYKAILLAEIETDPVIVVPPYLSIKDDGAFTVNVKERMGGRLAAKIKILNMYDYLLNNYGWDYANYFWNYARGWSEKIKKYNLKERKIPHCKYTKDGQCDLFCPHFCGKCNYFKEENKNE